MKKKVLYLWMISMFIAGIIKLEDGVMAQSPDDNELIISGELLTDERFLLIKSHAWAWNENRITLDMSRKFFKSSRFYSEIWLRNIGLPDIITSAQLYNKGNLDPYNFEVREAYVQLFGFLSKNLDITIGRQRIAWGTADKLNPTDNLNPYDMEDILDFGRHRGSDAINFNYYLNNNFSLQGVFVPLFQLANMPTGVFSEALIPEIRLPGGMVLRSYSDTIKMPDFSISGSSVSGLRFKGFAGGIDFSLSYVWGLDGLPCNTRNTFLPVDTLGGIAIDAQLSYARAHIVGADMATSLGGLGFWTEAALFIPEKDILMTNDFSALYPLSPIPVIEDSLLLDRSKPYLKFIAGTDYFFHDGSYLNLQFMHGFIHEKGNKNLNDYFFLQYEKTFFYDKLKVAPIGGAFIVTDWKDIQKNYALAYLPEITYIATPNSEITLSTAIFKGEGDSLFAKLNDYDMFILKLRFSF